MSSAISPVVIIGAGGAGMIAAWRAASLGASVILLEKNPKPGIKLLISGGGKCNVTHAGPMEDVRSRFLPREGRFLRPAFFRFSNDDIVRLLGERGVATYARPNGRVFPRSGNADDVVDALAGAVRDAGVDLRLNAAVTSVTATTVRVSGEDLRAHRVVIATGGVSYPKTGTTGDGIRWASALGHSVVPLRPALAPIGLHPPLPVAWRGVAIRGGELSLHQHGKRVFSWRDDILFSHEGITGPAALEVSRAAALALETGACALHFDFFPGREFADLDAALQSVITQYRGKMLVSLLEAWLPNRIVPALVQQAGVDPQKRGYVLTKEERRAVTHLLKDWMMGSVATIRIDRGEVTAGGVSLDEVDPHTMRSRKCASLLLCGEVLDIAGPVGGYNLQAAFSTGFVAGETAAGDWPG